MNINWKEIVNPVLDLEPEIAVRDPLLYYYDGLFHCYYTAVEHKYGNYYLYLDEITSVDLVHWSDPRRLLHSGLGFSSPGNIIKRGDEWIMCVQTYPIPPGKVWADETARLWYIKTRDFKVWSNPAPINPEGAQVKWTESHRQIDPCFAEYDGKYWCFYKAGGQLGLLASEDFENWDEASPERPIICHKNAQGNVSVENPCVVWDGDEFVMVYSPCVKDRGLGIARSKDLLNWYDIHDLDLPVLSWAKKKPTAGYILDMRDCLGKWVMMFHGERNREHAAALGIAWSDDLERWTMPGE